MRKTIILPIIGMLLLAGCQSEGDTGQQISSAKREMAQELSKNYFGLEPILRQAINEQQNAISVNELIERAPNSDFSHYLTEADQKIRTLKGIEQQADYLLEVRLANDAMTQMWLQGEVAPLIAFEPSGSETTWTSIEAFDLDGNLHQLDVNELPNVPVLVVDQNSAIELKAGLEVMRLEMNRLEQPTMVQPYMPELPARAQAIAAEFSVAADKAEPLHTMVMKRIILEDDHEPWISGKAEIYAIITGVDPSREEPVVDLVEMPYLDYAGKEYLPNQIVVYWSRYRWGAVDMVLMEQDDGTNYKDLAQLLVSAATKALEAFPDLDVPPYLSVIASITNQVLEAIPDSLLTNDDDLVDIFYTLQQGEAYIDHPAARVNAVATFEPLIIEPVQQ
ncbi:DUF3103 family protein [Ferrimonas aestuarii]|uniref:DUF3103 family protein n=1 Tax=Ferrimonas aestuarii TaxID=2569539 RepID=A0A4U1BRV2_9GAMM|nr:DUF3103 family protein [Ferrimonas aestuarii]TKB58353.1 DUF3103 family protein [Ferrimonas aestuarii]